MNRTVASLRARRRLDRRSPMRFVAPAWLLDMVRADLARGQTSAAERFATADAGIETWLAARAINATWRMDASTTLGGAQGAGPLLGWPTTVVSCLALEGSRLFLDGGTLDLGTVRDWSLKATNDYDVFADTFEGVAPAGVEILALTLSLCLSGKTSAPVTTNPWAVGS